MYALRSIALRRAACKLTFCFLLAFSLEGAALAMVFVLPWSPAVNWTLAGLVHLLAAGAFFIFPKRPRGLSGLGYYLPRLAGIITLFMPVAGPLGAFCSVVGAKILLKSQGLAHDYEGHDYRGDTLMEELDAMSSDEVLQDEVSIQPIIDILAGEDVNLKRGAISVLRRLGTPESIHLLKQSLTDDVPEVRFYAHTALSKLEEESVTLLQRAERKAKAGTPEDRKALVLAYRDYAASGLPEQSMLDHYQQSAYDMGTRVMFELPGDIELTMAVAGLALLRGDYDVAEGFFWNLLHLGTGTMEAYLGLGRIRFEQGDYLGLGHLMQQMQQAKVPPSDDPEVVKRFTLWTAPEAAA